MLIAKIAIGVAIGIITFFSMLMVMGMLAKENR